MNRTSYLSLLSLTVALAACGGNDSPPPVEPPVQPPVVMPPVMPPVITEVPASAYASVAAYTTYAATLAASETTEPLDTDKVVAPTTETAEPQDV